MKIEYVCQRNIVRSPTFEAVSKYFIAKKNLEELIEISSSGIDVDRFNRGQLRPDEVYKTFGYLIEAQKKKKLADENLMQKVIIEYTNRIINSDTILLAKKALTLFEAYCGEMRDIALLQKGIPLLKDWRYPESLKQTKEGDAKIIVVLAKEYIDFVKKIYSNRKSNEKPKILSITDFGEEPKAYGFEVADFGAIVEIALKSVPNLIDYCCTKGYVRLVKPNQLIDS
ncbi:MAG: hypothetical protein QW559_01110 [Candidatus Woesearchaeota archaeon]